MFFEETWLHPSYNDIHNACYEATLMFNSYGFKFDRIIGISRGGLLPAITLSHLLEIPMTPISYSARNGKGDDKNHENVFPSVEEGQIVLLVDDICDSGNTLYEVKNHYENQRVMIYTLALYYKSHAVPVIIPDFKWRTIPEDAGWVIFPYEVKGRV